jgi:hypothetical protein
MVAILGALEGDAFGGATFDKPLGKCLGKGSLNIGCELVGEAGH